MGLAVYGPAGQAEPSRRTDIHRSDLVAVINAPAESGFVDRAPDPEDRRRNVITLTAAGRAHLRRLDELLNGVQQDLPEPLTDPEREELVRLLTRLLAHHRQPARGAGAP
ncbi:MarR family winged helix-turn-helix transcriptional regulator [Embleya sp. NBC_00896]|uniref:MarR family winged helix-turn-helix transcriptional regulator n=1 Tax=Embleya sp. NBC_00896 TaxID=2975961 RepID=UPI002F907E6E|nr:MarR family winged helix-turn-helix transcriptional regulator [Embleya sp. NBC_00896]